MTQVIKKSSGDGINEAGMSNKYGRNERETDRSESMISIDGRSQTSKHVDDRRSGLEDKIERIACMMGKIQMNGRKLDIETEAHERHAHPSNVNSKVEVKGGKDASKRKKKKINKYPSDDSDTAEDDESDHAQPHCRRKSKRRSGSDQDAQKEQRKMATKPDKYDGKTPFCSFLAKFESC